MIVSIASGKGGTGRTTLAVNLAICISEPIRLLDCDVEEPNCHLFLKTGILRSERVMVPLPVIDNRLCNGCGECSEICQYNAIVSLKTKPLVFPSLCHGCGGCVKICPESAITEGSREIGSIETGTVGNIELIQGRLNVGEALSPTLIRAVRRRTARDRITIVDCPPGTSCPLLTAVRNSDFVILVAEPTPFGLHDLKLAVETMRSLDLDFGVVVNRVISHDHAVKEYCSKEQISILLEIPDDRRIAEAYSRGQLIIEAVPELKESFELLHCSVLANQGHRVGASCCREDKAAESSV
jgi:MinD superfamily P-loop ATPase